MDSRKIKITVITSLLMSCLWLPIMANETEESKSERKRFVPAIIAGYYVTEALWAALLAGTTVYGAYTASQLIQAGVKKVRDRTHHRGCSSNGYSCEDVGCNRDGGSCNSVKYEKPGGKIGMQCQCLYF